MTNQECHVTLNMSLYKILYESMIKTMEDSKCDMSTALAWVVSAKNQLQNVNG